MHVLVLAAHPPDLRGLRDAVGDSLYGEVNRLVVGGKAVGVGLPAASAGAARRLARIDPPPMAVVHLGTCGVYPGVEGYRPNDVVVANRIQLFDAGVDAGSATFPEPMSTQIEANAALTAGIHSAWTRAHKAVVLTPLAQTRNDQVAATPVARCGACVENLEAFAMASACHLAQLPFTSLLGVTHVVGSYGDDDLRRFRRSASLAAAQALTAWMHAGAPGLPHGGHR